LAAATVAAAYYLSRPARGRDRLDLLVREAFVEVPWYYRWVQYHDAQARRSGNRSWLPETLVRKAYHADVQFWSKVSNAKAELARLGNGAWPAIPALLEALESSDAQVRRTAGEILGRIKAEESPLFEKFKAGLNNQERPAKTFGWLLKGKNEFGRPFDRHFLLIGLAASGPAAKFALPELIEIADSKAEDHELRALAFAAMSGLGPQDSKAIQMLRRVIDDMEEWPDVRQAALRTLVRISPEDANLSGLLHQLLRDERVLIRIEAADSLRKSAPPDELLPVLRTALDHQLPSVRRAALEVLARMADSARPLQPNVQALLSDTNEPVRRAAKETLEKLSLQN
jgi:HEAT repeat protein